MSDLELLRWSHEQYRAGHSEPAHETEKPIDRALEVLAGKEGVRLTSSDGAQIDGRAHLVSKTPLTEKIGELAHRVLDRVTTNFRAPAFDHEEQIRTSLLHHSSLHSDWEEMAEPPGRMSSRDGSVDNLSASGKLPVHRRLVYRSLEIGGLSGSIASFLVSGVSFAIKFVTSTISPLSSAIPFIGLFNGLANGFLFGKAIDRLRFYGHLTAELKARQYNPESKNFGVYSELILAKYPNLRSMDISPSRLMQFLESEVRRKRMKYNFYLAARTCAFGASVAGCLGGLAAFAVPVLAVPALCAGIPLAVAGFALKNLGDWLSKQRRDPLIRT